MSLFLLRRSYSVERSRKMLTNNELVRNRKETTLACLKVRSWGFLVGTEKETRNSSRKLAKISISCHSV